MGELSLAVRVAKGAALLDVKVPGWHKRIDTDRLEQGSDDDDLFGQLFEGADYYEVRTDLVGPGAAPRTGSPTAQAHGFECSIYRGDVYEYDRLTDEWRRIIKARCAQGIPLGAGGSGVSAVEPLSYERAQQLAREVVAEHGADYVYVKQPNGDFDCEDRPVLSCFYVVDDAPSCLVAHVLHRHGVPLDAFDGYEHENAKDVVPALVDSDAAAVLFLNTAQKEQDEGIPWGRALDIAACVVAGRAALS
ncbi:hypothetical protein [Umezawaea sp. NPDC059074]|uniref:hypothetical protein n=1 Tax=Umezawaea sp. NPDC059074 TaxID=3346716 RepID=UPI0036C1C89E